MSTIVNRHFAVALKELRSAVTVCCWVIGLALAVQVVAWSLLTYTDIRYDVIQEAPQKSASGEVLTATEIRRQEIQTPPQEGDVVPIDVNRQLSKADHLMKVCCTITGAVGTMGSLALLPLLALGVVLAAGSATPGVDRAAGAFVWAVVLVSLVIPWGRVFEAMPFDGIYAGYAMMTEDVDNARSGVVTTGLENIASHGLLFYGRYLVLPLAGIAGIAAIGLRFRSGIDAGLIPREDLRLDPELEKEVAKIKATSLVGGGRIAGALRNTMKPEDEEPPTRPLRAVSPGDPLKRPI